MAHPAEQRHGKQDQSNAADEQHSLAADAIGQRAEKRRHRHHQPEADAVEQQRDRHRHGGDLMQPGRAEDEAEIEATAVERLKPMTCSIASFWVRNASSSGAVSVFGAMITGSRGNRRRMRSTMMPITSPITKARRQPQIAACSAVIESVIAQPIAEPSSKPPKAPNGAKLPTRPRRLGKRLFDQQHQRGRVFAADGKALREAQQDKQEWRGKADLRVGRQQGHQAGGHRHRDDRADNGGAPPQFVADMAEDHPAQRPRRGSRWRRRRTTRSARRRDHASGKNCEPMAAAKKP